MDGSAAPLPLLATLPRHIAGDPYAFAFPAEDRATLPDLIAFFQEYGYVVVENVFSQESCQETREAMWEVLEGQNPGINRADPRTWGQLKSKGQYGLSIRGPSFHPALIKNRQNPLLARVLCAVTAAPHVDDVIVSQDRFTVYRSTVHDDTEVDGEAFSTGASNLHLDLSPWWHMEDAQEVRVGIDTLQYEDPQDYIKENNLVVKSFGRHVQCVLNFEDNHAEDGGTLIVPYFHSHMAQWAMEHAALRKSLPWVTLPKKDEAELLRYAHRVCMRPGSVLIWDQRMMHGTARNHSRRCRMAQYLKAYPRSLTFPSPDPAIPNCRLVRRAQGILRQLEAAGIVELVSETGWKLFGLDVLMPHPVRSTTS